jgi:Tol biopolymer transport system component/predicted Ser/Thr protein kinase
MIGKTLGHYQITEKLGEGGMGVVYKARDMHLDRFVAVKVLAAEKVADPDRKRRFVQEAKAASALNHPNIIHVYDIDQADGTDFIAMEYVDGKTLDQLIPRKGMRLGEALKYSAQIGDALAVAHAAGIVHRDLKPANVMVTEKGLVKVLDFGLAKLTERIENDEFGTTETMEPRTEEGAIVGTVAYMSPEQAEGKKLDTRSDIFSFGSMLYEMLTGQRAFRGDTRASTIASILRDEPKSISQVTGAMPRDVEKLVRRCLQKDVLRRFQHMDDVKVALEELKEESESGVLEAAVPVGAKRASPAKYAVLAVVAVVLIAAGAYWLARQRPTEPEAPLIPVPLTSYPGWEYYPSFSPDGNYVAFQWRPEGPGTNFDIYIKQIGVEPPSRLTSDPANDWGPAWSPDGKFIAFFRKSATGTALIWIPQRGGQERVLGEVNLPDRPDVCLAWTPDSKGVVLPWEEAGKAGGGLYLISLETEERRRLTDNKGDGAPALSPDGGVLAFSRKNGAGADLYLLRLGEGYKPNGEPEKIPSGIRSISGVAWTPDGKDIVVCDEFSGLWRMAASMSGKPVRLAFASDANGPAISRQGNRLAYEVVKSDIDIHRVDLSGQDLNPGVPFKFISSTRDEVRPAYSPDGKKIAFHSNRSGAWEVWVCDRDGSNAVQLTSLRGDDWDGSAWSPDGRRIAFGLVAAGKLQMFVVNASGGGARSLAAAQSGAMFHPSWSRDGQSIYFRSTRSGSSEIWKMPAGGGDAVQITPNGSERDLPQVSPDGKYLYYLKPIRYPQECSVWKLPVGGGEETLVFDSTGCLSPYAVWEQGIYFFTPQDKQGRKDLTLYDFRTRGARKILTIETTGAFFVAASPDGRTILYTQDDKTGSDLMLVENFH